MSREITIQEIKESFLSSIEILPSDKIRLIMANKDNIIEIIKKISIKYGASGAASMV